MSRVSTLDARVRLHMMRRLQGQSVPGNFERYSGGSLQRPMIGPLGSWR